jgi:hypothetical protein
MPPGEPPRPAPASQPQPEAPQPDIHNPLAVMQPGEQVLCEINRHPIGLIGTYFAAAFIVVTTGVLAFVVAPRMVTNFDHTRLLSMAGLVFMVVTLFTLLFVWITTTVYKGNRWVVTTDSITQVTQTSLFAKQSSQLSLANLEDITAEQNGIFSHLYNYGVLKAETAGERSKFFLSYCPRPTYYAQCILDAREKFEQFGGRRGDFEARASNPGGVNVNTQ